MCLSKRESIKNTKQYGAASSLLSITVDYDDISTMIISLDHGKEPRLKASYTLFTAKISRERRETSALYVTCEKSTRSLPDKIFQTKAPFTVGPAATQHGEERKELGKMLPTR